MDCSLPGSSVYGILQARTLEWVAIHFSRGSSQPTDQTQDFRIAGVLYQSLFNAFVQIHNLSWTFSSLCLCLCCSCRPGCRFLYVRIISCPNLLSLAFGLPLVPRISFSSEPSPQDLSEATYYFSLAFLNHILVHV